MKPDVTQIHEKRSTAYAVKSVSGAVKDVDFTKRIVTGFFNTEMYFDSDQDVSLPDSTTKSILERGPASNAPQKIKHLLDHDWDTLKMPGRIQVLERRTEVFKGVSITGTYFESKMLETQVGNDTLINYQEGIIDNHSFGFKYIDGVLVYAGESDWDKYINLLINPEEAIKAGYMFLWKEYMMMEGSTVTFGANKLTPYLGAKSTTKEGKALKLIERIQLFKKQLRTGRQSDEALQTLEMQAVQLEQYVKEMFDEEPSLKDTLFKQGRNDTDTQDEGSSLDYKSLLNIFN